MNDIKEKTQSNMSLQANDTIVFRVMDYIDDHDTLHQDLDTLSEWSTTLLMDFNVCKCAILPIIMKRNESILYYTIFGNTAERVDDHEYLGVLVAHNLRWKKHCNKITKKTNKTLGLLRRTLSPYSNEI